MNYRLVVGTIYIHIGLFLLSKNNYLFLSIADTTGVRDNVHDLDQTVTLTLMAQSKDPKYNGLNARLTAVNKDIYFPEVNTVQPTVFPQIGANATISGGT